MMEGVSGEAAVAGRSPGFVEPLLDLRQQSHHHRRPHQSGFLRKMWRVVSLPMDGTWNGSSNANDLDLLREAFDHFKKTVDRPTLIIVDSHIGYGAPTKQDTSAAHGEPLGRRRDQGDQRSAMAGRRMPSFWFPRGALKTSKRSSERAGANLRGEWMSLFSAYQKRVSGTGRRDAGHSASRTARKAGMRRYPRFPPDAKGIASRDSSGKVLNAIAKHHPWLLGGSADLSPSTKTRLTFEGAGEVRSQFACRKESALRSSRARHGSRSSTAWR